MWMTKKVLEREKKKRRRRISSERKHATVMVAEKIRNASGHQGENEPQ